MNDLLEVTFPGGVAVGVAVKGYTVLTDQPAPLGGGTAPSPFDLFLASLATCAGFYALRFCQEREIATDGLGISLETQRDGANPKRLATISIRLRLPQSFPEKYRDAITRAVDHCTVKRTIVDPPQFELMVM